MPVQTLVWDEIQVVGYIWVPDNVLCAQIVPIKAQDLDSISAIGNGKLSGITREDIQIWLDSHAGDFSTVVDFRADFGTLNKTFDWEDKENEYKFQDSFYPPDEYEPE